MPGRRVGDRASRLHGLYTGQCERRCGQRPDLDTFAGSKTHPRVHRAWALEEGLRAVFTLARQGFKQATKHALYRWLGWCGAAAFAFVTLARRIAAHREAIHVSIDHDLSNGLVESVNTKLRLLTRMAFGYADPYALIALGMLALGGLCPPLPGRTSRR